MSRPPVSLMQIRFKRTLRRTKELSIRFYRAMFSWRTLISFIGIAMAAVLCAVAITPVRYNISVGMVPTNTITATRDVVDEITTEALRQAAADAVSPTYITKDDVMESVLSDLTQIFSQLDSAIQYSETLEDYSTSRRYTAEELEYARTIITTPYLRDYQLRTLLNTTREDLAFTYSILYDAIQNTMSGYVIEGSEYLAVSNIMQIVGYRVDTSLLQNVVQPVLNEIIQPNIVIDQEATDAARELARAEVEPVIYKQGQNIVVKGEGRVERYQYEMLSSMGLLSNASISITIYLGAALLVALVMSIAMILLRIVCREIVYDAKRLILLFIVFILSFVLCIAARIFNIYLSPVSLCALLLASMLGLKCALIFNVAIAILVSALAAGGSTSYSGTMIQILVCGLCSGYLGAVVVYKHTGRLRVIASGVAAGICGFAVIMALGLMTGSTDSMLRNALWILAGGGIAGVLCVAVQPLLELIFNLPTPTKLLELSNPNHPLLHRLLLEAPGTYHHSIVVSNLAEAAAEAIGANPLLARVGGYYHNIGKLRRPLYFKDNQLG
ncbi:MAG: HDIG domain-containing protein [Clostridia bacterium]|nr:HDIG domain-containing protein [Clostridia bacterium]